MDVTDIKYRRKGPDTVVKLADTFSVLTWLLIVVSLFIYNIAEPATISYVTIRFPVLDLEAATFAIELLLFVNIFIAICGIVANSMRNKRKTDKFHTSLVVSSLLSLMAVIFLI